MKNMNSKTEEKEQCFKFGFIILGAFCLVLSQLIASITVDVFYMKFQVGSSSLLFALRGFLEISFFCITLKIYTKKILKIDLSFFRIKKPKVDLHWLLIAVLLPSCVIGFYLFFLDGSICYDSRNSLESNIAFALKLALVSGITEELFFRGYVMKIVENKWGKGFAIFVPSIVFACLHSFRGIGGVDFLQLLIAGTIVGIMFSLITYFGDNIWNAVIVHVIWNLLVLGVFNISTNSNYSSIINYSYESNNMLITGGQFGIEAGAPAIIGYLTIIGFILVIKYKKKSDSITSE